MVSVLVGLTTVAGGDGGGNITNNIVHGLSARRVSRLKDVKKNKQRGEKDESEEEEGDADEREEVKEEINGPPQSPITATARGRTHSPTFADMTQTTPTTRVTMKDEATMTYSRRASSSCSFSSTSFNTNTVPHRGGGSYHPHHYPVHVAERQKRGSAVEESFGGNEGRGGYDSITKSEERGDGPRKSFAESDDAL